MSGFFKILSCTVGAFSLAFLLTTAVMSGSADSSPYIMRDYNGRIAVFRTGEAAPDEVFDIFTDSLPEEEHKKLLQGITIQDDEELQRLIEAYTG